MEIESQTKESKRVEYNFRILIRGRVTDERSSRKGLFKKDLKAMGKRGNSSRCSFVKKGGGGKQTIKNKIG